MPKFKLKKTRLAGLLALSLAFSSPAEAQVVISEFMAENSDTLVDEDGDSSDWIELYNESNDDLNINELYICRYSLLKFSINQVKSHFKPRNIYVNKLAFVEKNMDINDFYKYFLTILVFIISLVILWSILTIFGLDLESSFKLSILTIMNTVNSSMIGLNDFNFGELPYLLKYSLIVFMIIGRVELLTILILIKKFFFKN